MARALSLLALIAQYVFVAAWLVAPLWQGPRYSVLAHSISDMYAVTAPAGFVLVVIFSITGLVTILFALLVVRRSLDGWAATLGSILLALSIFGLGDLLSPLERLACRLADVGCTDAAQVSNSGGTLDAALSTAGIVLFIAAGFFLAEAMRTTEGWTRWAWPTRIAMIVQIVFFAADGFTHVAGFAGLFERLLALLGALVIAALAYGILLVVITAPRRTGTQLTPR